MEFKRHPELADKHAVLSASKYHWLNYSDERLFEYVDNLDAARRGTELHELAKRLIKLGVKLPNTTQTLNMYVNDAIGYRMSPEQPLCYHPNYAFGTADAISFRDKILRIFDLKNGKTKPGELQLITYAAYFCLEYKIRPGDITYDLRFYQNDEVYILEVDVQEVVFAMSRIKELTALLIQRFEEEV